MISSLDNQRVVAARALRTSRGRLAAEAFLVEGPHAVDEVLGAGLRPREVYATPEFVERDRALIARVDGSGVPIRQVTERVMRRLGDTVTPQGIVAVVDRAVPDLGALLASAPTLLAVLVGVADPGNVGTVIRTADALGADAVVVTRDSADVYAGKAVRASAGSLFHLPIVTGLAADEVVDQLAAAGLQLLAAAGSGEDSIDELLDTGALRTPTAWIFGNEAHGLPPPILAATDRVVRIRMPGRAESLNLGAAAAICLHASALARRGLGDCFPGSEPGH